jgi:hypothetical protein
MLLFRRQAGDQPKSVVIKKVEFIVKRRTKRHNSIYMANPKMSIWAGIGLMSAKKG